MNCLYIFSNSQCNSYTYNNIVNFYICLATLLSKVHNIMYALNKKEIKCTDTVDIELQACRSSEQDETY